MKNQKDAPFDRPVSEEELQQHLDDLFADEPQTRTKHLKATLMQAVRYGVDHGTDSPFQSSLAHLAQLIDRKIGDLRDQGLIPTDTSEKALQAWGEQVEAWGKRVNQRQRDRWRR